MSVEKWLNELDPGLVVYADNLKQLGFCSVKMIKLLKLKDLQKMQCTIPAPHRRMILNAVSKLQTPESKNKGDIETPDSEDDGVKRRRKENVSSNDLMSKNLPPRKLFDTTVPKEQSKMSGNQMFLELFVVFRLTGCNIVPLVSTALLYLQLDIRMNYFANLDFACNTT